MVRLTQRKELPLKKIYGYLFIFNPKLSFLIIHLIEIYGQTTMFIKPLSLSSCCGKSMMIPMKEERFLLSTRSTLLLLWAVVLLINPITGQKMCTWKGEIEAQSFLQDLRKYIDSSPYEDIASVASNRKIEKISLPDQDLAIFLDDDFDDFDESEDEKTLISYLRKVNVSSDRVVVPSCGEEVDETMTLSKHEEETCLSSDLFEFPILTEEPKGDCDRSVVCSICVRFPDGRRKQRNFLKSEPIQLLWSFCYSHMEHSEKKAFKLVQTMPGASKTLDYGANSTFDQSGIANSIISVIWE